jgi:two-component system chemotaxis response regulator CheY
MSHTILLVDDSPTHRSLIQVFLTGRGFRFVEADTGKHALELLKDTRPDLIIADINMPEMDGMTFVRELRGHPRSELRKLPVVLLTGDNRSSERSEEGLAAGADEFLRKPISSAGVLEVVSKLLDLPDST